MQWAKEVGSSTAFWRERSPWLPEQWCNTATYRSDKFFSGILTALTWDLSAFSRCTLWCSPDICCSVFLWKECKNHHFCHQGPLDVPSGCLLSGLELSTLPSIRRLPLSRDIIIQGHRVELGELQLDVYTVMGAHDDLQVRGDVWVPPSSLRSFLFQLSVFSDVPPTSSSSGLLQFQ